MSSRNHVAKGRAARERRYEDAVRRQIDFCEAVKDIYVFGISASYLYARPEEFLRRGDTVEMFAGGDL